MQLLVDQTIYFKEENGILTILDTSESQSLKWMHSLFCFIVCLFLMNSLPTSNRKKKTSYTVKTYICLYLDVEQEPM